MSLILQGLVDQMDIDAYHRHPSLSHSLCKYLEPEVAPLQFWHRSWLNPYQDTGSLKGSHINTGNLMHAAMENWEQFQSTIKILPNVARTSQKGYIGGAPGGQLEALLVLRSRLLAIPDIARAVGDGKPEVSLYSSHHGVPIRSRPDWLSDKIEIHWKFVSRMDFLGQMIDRLRYIEGLAWYRRVRIRAGLSPIRQVMYLCETKAPYEIRTVEPSLHFLDENSKEWAWGHHALMRFKDLYSQFGDGMWPDHRLKPQDICTGSAGGGRYNIQLPSSYDKRLAA